jgi:6-phosphogluconolactonase
MKHTKEKCEMKAGLPNCWQAVESRHGFDQLSVRSAHRKKMSALIPFADADALASGVSSSWLDEIAIANHSNRSQFVALSGGRITLKLFAAVIEQSKERGISLKGVHFFWADERCVPPDDRDSSYAAAAEHFFRPLGIEPDRIHRLRGELSLESATHLANADIQKTVPLNSAGQPVFDIVFLGMGEDGHVASLFPDETEAARLDPSIYRAITNSPKPPPNRVTLGYSAITAAKHIWVLASGTGKEIALRDSLRLESKTPLGRVLKMHSSAKVFTDIKV